MPSRLAALAGVSLLALAAAVGCGKVNPSEPDADVDDGDAGDDLDAGGDIDAAACPTFDIPAGGIELHTRFCVSALGFNPSQATMTMNIPCPGVGTGPGTHGLILRNAETQADGCPTSGGVTRILVPQVMNALTQTSTGQDVVIAAGSRLRVRLACRQGIANCRGRVQITGAPANAQPNVQIFPAAAFQLVTGTDVIDVDVPIPAGLIGNTTDLNLISQSDGNGTSDVMFINPHLAPP